MDDTIKKCPDCESWQTMVRELQNIIRRERYRRNMLEAEIEALLKKKSPHDPGA